MGRERERRTHRPVLVAGADFWSAERMRLAFSTLGVPAMPLPEVLSLAAESGFHGVELRAHPEEPVHPELDGPGRARVVRQFHDAGLDVLAVAGYPKVAAPGDDEPVRTALRDLVHLAHDLRAPYVRVFPGGPEDTADAGQAARAESDATAVRRLAEVAPLAADSGVRILLETHDTHRTGAAVARILREVGHPACGALWDVLHTWRGGEQPEETHRQLAPHLGYVQVKDVASREDLTPLPPGAGVLPLAEVVELLTRAEDAPPEQSDPPGPVPDEAPVGDRVPDWLCWEYEKRWYPDIPELPALLPRVSHHLLDLLSRSA